MHYPYGCGPTAAAGQPGVVVVPYYYYIPWCCACGQPAANCPGDAEPAGKQLDAPQELTVDGSAASASVEAVVGGTDDVAPALETLPAPGASNPEVTVEKVAGAVTTLLHISPVPAGYTVNHDLAGISPGTRIKLTANGCFARLRWCERVEY